MLWIAIGRSARSSMFGEAGQRVIVGSIRERMSCPNGRYRVKGRCRDWWLRDRTSGEGNRARGRQDAVTNRGDRFRFGYCRRGDQPIDAADLFELHEGG